MDQRNWEPGAWVYIWDRLDGAADLRFGRIAAVYVQPGYGWVAVTFLHQDGSLRRLTGPAHDLLRYQPTAADLADWCIAELEAH